MNTARIDSFWRRWWSSPAGGAEVVWLTLPMIISSGSFAIMQFADRVFLTWYNPEAMGASFSGGLFFWLIVAFPFSIAAYTNAFVSQYNGAKQFRRIGNVVWQGVWLGMALAIPIFLAWPWYEGVFRLFGHSESMAAMESEYLFWSLLGFGPVIANESLSAFFSGRKRMNVVMGVNLVAVMLNILLDYGLIFGVGGLPKWGLAGAAIATAASQWVRGGIFLLLMLRADRSGAKNRPPEGYGLRAGCRLDRTEAWRLFTFGGMGGVQFFLDMGAFSLFVLLLGTVGESAATASAVAFNLNTLTFLPVVGTGVAVTTFVGNYLGEEKPQLARKGVLSAIVIGGAYTGVFMMVYLFFPKFLLAAYAASDPEAFAPYYGLTTMLLRFVAVYLFFDTLSIIFCSALKGAGDTRFVMIVTLLMTPILVFVPWLGVKYWGFGLFGCWGVLTVWVCVLGGIYAARFVGGRWMSQRLFQTNDDES